MERAQKATALPGLAADNAKKRNVPYPLSQKKLTYYTKEMKCYLIAIIERHMLAHLMSVSFGIVPDIRIRELLWK